MKEEDNSNIEVTARIDALTAEKELLTEKISKLQSRVDLAEKSYEKIKKELNEERAVKADDIIEKKVMDRVELFLYAAPYLQDIEAYMKHTDREIMETALNSVRRDSEDFSNYSDEYVKGRFDNFINNQSRAVNSKKVFDVLKQRHDMEVNGSMHDYIAKRAKDDWNKKQYGDN